VNTYINSYLALGGTIIPASRDTSTIMPRFLFRQPNIVQRFMIHHQSKRGGKPKNELEPSDDVVSERLDTTEADFDPMYTMEPPMETAPVIECRDCSLGCKDPAVSYEEESAMRAPIAPGAYMFNNNNNSRIIIRIKNYVIRLLRRS